MKRKVTVIIEVDPTDYYQAVDTDKGAVELVRAMIRLDADFPLEDCVITCGKESSRASN
jgi:hypothetical protein